MRSFLFVSCRSPIDFTQPSGIPAQNPDNPEKSFVEGATTLVIHDPFVPVVDFTVS